MLSLCRSRVQLCVCLWVFEKENWTGHLIRNGCVFPQAAHYTVCFLETKILPLSRDSFFVRQKYWQYLEPLYVKWKNSTLSFHWYGTSYSSFGQLWFNKVWQLCCISWDGILAAGFIPQVLFHKLSQSERRHSSDLKSRLNCPKFSSELTSS